MVRPGGGSHSMSRPPMSSTRIVIQLRGITRDPIAGCASQLHVRARPTRQEVHRFEEHVFVVGSVFRPENLPVRLQLTEERLTAPALVEQAPELRSERLEGPLALQRSFEPRSDSIPHARTPVTDYRRRQRVPVAASRACNSDRDISSASPRK